MTRVLTFNGLTVKVSKFEACRSFPVRFMLFTNDNAQIQFRHGFRHYISIQESDNFLSIQLAYPVLQALDVVLKRCLKMLFEHRNLVRLSLQCLYKFRFPFRIFNSTDLEIMALSCLYHCSVTVRQIGVRQFSSEEELPQWFVKILFLTALFFVFFFFDGKVIWKIFKIVAKLRVMT